MPVTFKNRKLITLHMKTAEDDLILCTECGGLQAMSNTSLDLDCPVCNGTGYENLWSEVTVAASYRSGAIQRWNAVNGAVDFLGECSIKLDYKYRPFLDRSEHLVMDGQEWKYSFVREPGEAMGQRRIVLALSRK